MNEMLMKELSANKENNEIFYSLTDYDIWNVQKFITAKKWNDCIDINIIFQQQEIDNIFPLLSTTYNLPNKVELDIYIWENFLANKIMKELVKKSGISSTQNLEKEKELLMSFNIEEYLLYFPNRTTIQMIEDLTYNHLRKKVRIHYFPSPMMPIDLQNVMGKLLSTPHSFTNILYTTQCSIRSYYKQGRDWLLQNNDYQEIWKNYINLKGK